MIYARVPLEDCLRRVKRAYNSKRDLQGLTTVDLIKLLGFKSKNGTATKMIGALRQYGLIQTVQKKTIFTESALRYFSNNVSHLERASLRTQFAYFPQVFRELADLEKSRPWQKSELVERLVGYYHVSVEKAVPVVETFLSNQEYLNQVAEDAIGAHGKQFSLDPSLALNPCRVAVSTNDFEAEILFSGSPSPQKFRYLIQGLETSLGYQLVKTWDDKATVPTPQ